jgi:hypothetical protein
MNESEILLATPIREAISTYSGSLCLVALCVGGGKSFALALGML